MWCFVASCVQNEELEDAIAPVCHDVRLCLVDEMASLRSLAEKTCWLMTSTRTTAASELPHVSSMRGNANILADIAMSRLLYKLADARCLTNTRMDLATETGASVGATEAPKHLLNLWGDVVGHGAALIADCRPKQRGDARNTPCRGVVYLLAAESVSRTTASACWFARSLASREQASTLWPDVSTCCVAHVT